MAAGSILSASLPTRRAKVVAGDPSRKCVLEGDAPVSGHSSQTVFVRELTRTQPPFTSDEYAICERLFVEHPPFREACRKRNIDPATVRIDPWCVGWTDDDDDPSRRLAEPILYLQRGNEALGDNLYTQPLEGCTMRMDLWSTPPAVIAFEWPEGDPTTALPPDPKMRFPDAAAEARRPPLPPLLTSQPLGDCCSLGPDGTLRWQAWEAVVGFNAREGAVLFNVRYAGRPVAWRLSFAEMVVPYGDPHAPHYRKAAFDAGEDGLGRNVHSLDPTRCDCAPGGVTRFLDAAMTAADGSAEVVRHAVCVHEEDGGLLWKHLDWRTGESVARRSRVLVVMFLCTVANYTYGFAYKLGIDASIHMEATLTGILSIGALPTTPTTTVEGGSSSSASSRGDEVPRRPWGQTLSRAGLYGPDHQHFFVARLDMAVDGISNRVVEVGVEPSGTSTRDDEDAFVATHGRHNAFRRTATTLTSELTAAREACSRSARHWVVESTERTNAVGEPTAWKLEPGAGSAVAVACDHRASYLERGGFLHKNLWVTAYDPKERYPGGDYPNQRPPSMPDGLPHWVQRDKPLDGEDVVLWHVFGVTHIVRTEDAPVMPCERVGFAIKPFGFFDTSPCIDVPCDRCAQAAPKKSRL